MAIETLRADTVLDPGACLTPANAIGAPDGVFTENADQTNWAARWGFTNPVNPLTTDQTHTCTVTLRRSAAGGNDPTVQVDLYSAGALVTNIVPAGTTITGDVSTTRQGTFTTANVTNVNDLEILVTATGSTGKTTVRRNVQVDGFAVAVDTSPPDTVAPTNPTGLAATDVANPVLTWTASTDATGVTKYEIERSTTSGAGFAKIGEVNGTTTTYTDTSALGNTTYYYRVRALDAAPNASGYSNQATAVTPLAYKATLTWNANTEPDLAGYNAHRAAVSGGPYTKVNAALLVPNLLSANSSSFETDVTTDTYWENLTPARSTAIALEGASSVSISITPAQETLDAYFAPLGFNLAPSTQYTWFAHVYCASAFSIETSRTYLQENGGTFRKIALAGSGLVSLTAGWNLIGGTGTTPADWNPSSTIILRPARKPDGTGWDSTKIVHYDKLMVAKAAVPPPWMLGGNLSYIDKPLPDPDATYYYTVTAVDTTGNESAASGEANTSGFAPPVTGAGISTGLSTATGMGGVARRGSSVVTGSSVATGAAGLTLRGVGTTDGSSTVTAAPSVLRRATGIADGTSSAGGAASVRRSGAGLSSGSASTTGLAAVVLSATATAPGTSSATAVSSVSRPAMGLASGTSSTTATSNVARPATGAADGASSTTGSSRVALAGAGASSGASTTAGLGSVQVAGLSGAGISQGASSTTASGAVSLRAGGAVSGTSSATGLASLALPGSGAASGTSSVTVASSVARPASGVASGASSTQGSGSSRLSGTAVSSGVGTVQASGTLAPKGVGVSTGSSSTTAGSRLTVGGAAASGGASSVVASGSVETAALGGAGSSGGVSSATATARLAVSGAASSAGSSAVTASSAGAIPGMGVSGGVSSAVALASVKRLGASNSAGASTVVATAHVVYSTTTQANGSSTVAGVARVFVQASGRSTGEGSVTAQAVMLFAGSASSDGASLTVGVAFVVLSGAGIRPYVVVVLLAIPSGQAILVPIPAGGAGLVEIPTGAARVVRIPIGSTETIRVPEGALALT